MTHSKKAAEACYKGGVLWRPRPVVDAALEIIANALALIRTWHARAHERRQLAAMTERELRDIGLRRYEANLEINKPFWRA